MLSINQRKATPLSINSVDVVFLWDAWIVME